jgi:hypothetical protein
MMLADNPIVAMAIKPDYDRVEWHLYNWARYMRTGGYAGLSLPGRASGQIGISHAADFDQLADNADRIAAKTCDSVIRDLKPLEQKAIRCGYLGEDWTHVLNEAAVLVVAKEGVRLGLERKGTY